MVGIVYVTKATKMLVIIIPLMISALPLDMTLKIYQIANLNEGYMII